ncbi:phosphatidylethanolamine-binding protein [Lysobacter enzymogenes]|uniref:YbhB/YbcL family Raf kinase inhibitor-like protein n=1 Tax=Lysobacter enzymogenes TaxID=69 RepID=UPI001F152D98|nr:YbhB/YbcL family Raf kinase inhibitor-like protein [Lysobacter enzymogenes]MBN7134854.1 phosphatidylethanolamine-binding protein [Lysobacter enzymogenes]
MSSLRRLIVLILVLAALSLPLAMATSQAHAGDFRLRSADLPHDRPIAARHVYAGFGCDGGNLSPALEWTDPPAGTRSFAVTVYDPDAPSGSGWWHWVVLDLPADVRALPRGGAPLPAGAVQTRTDFGAPGYGGPCPPPGRPHRYRFEVWALKTASLGLGADASGAMAGFAIRANALGHATLEASYGR